MIRYYNTMSSITMYSISYIYICVCVYIYIFFEYVGLRTYILSIRKQKCDKAGTPSIIKVIPS